jgi:thymidylate synthase (FAD)
MHIELDAYFGTWRDVARIARTSTQASDNPARDEKLVRYLYRNQHTSPFEFVVTRWYVEAPIFVARQWMRHRTWSYSEQSARYTEIEDEAWRPLVWRKQAEKNRQSSYGEVENPHAAKSVYNEAIADAFAEYRKLLKFGASREQARAVLPQSTLTRFYAQADMHNLLHFLRLRADNHAQEEIQWYANRMREIMASIDDLALFERLLQKGRNDQ